MLCTFFLVQPDGDTATTSTSYGKLGKLLVMELRKTEFDPDECQGIKVGANVSVNKNIRLSSSGKMVKFSASSIVFHHGPGVTQGHYTGVHRLLNPQGKVKSSGWFSINDNKSAKTRFRTATIPAKFAHMVSFTTVSQEQLTHS